MKMTETDRLYLDAQAAIVNEKVAERMLAISRSDENIKAYHDALKETTRTAQELFAHVIAMGKNLGVKL